jgi:MOSC domain-containing protein YiiM
VNHGGPDKAVCVYSLDHYAYWREAFAAVGIEPNALTPGAFGENFSVAGLTEESVCVGDVWRVGDAGETGARRQEDGRDEAPCEFRRGAVFQISQPRQPCWKLARRWGIKTLAAQVIETGKTGWYFRVIEEGVVEAGMAMTLVERPCPEWTIERANSVMHREKGDRQAARRLADVEWLSESWRGELRRRVAATQSRANSECS